MRPRVGAGVAVSRSFPRVSGDEPRLLEATEKDTMFSPRERG